MYKQKRTSKTCASVLFYLLFFFHRIIYFNSRSAKTYRIAHTTVAGTDRGGEKGADMLSIGLSHSGHVSVSSQYCWFCDRASLQMAFTYEEEKSNKINMTNVWYEFPIFLITLVCGQGHT